MHPLHLLLHFPPSRTSHPCKRPSPFPASNPPPLYALHGKHPLHLLLLTSLTLIFFMPYTTKTLTFSFSFLPCLASESPSPPRYELPCPPGHYLYILPFCLPVPASMHYLTIPSAVNTLPCYIPHHVSVSSPVGFISCILISKPSSFLTLTSHSPRITSPFVFSL